MKYAICGGCAHPIYSLTKSPVLQATPNVRHSFPICMKILLWVIQLNGNMSLLATFVAVTVALMILFSSVVKTMVLKTVSQQGYWWGSSIRQDISNWHLGGVYPSGCSTPCGRSPDIPTADWKPSLWPTSLMGLICPCRGRGMGFQRGETRLHNYATDTS